MPYRDMFTNDIYQNEFDETMTRKFPNTYKVIKTIYPDAYKLPEDEIHTMSNILRHQGETYDDAESLLKDYINQQEPLWQKNYFNTDTEIDNDEGYEAQPTLQPMTDSQRQQAYQLARQIRPKNITISEADDNLATNPWARKAALIYQGMANASFNPFGYAARSMDMDTRPVHANNAFERAIESSAGMLYDTTPLVTGGEALAGSQWATNLAQSANPWLRSMGKGVQYLGKPSAPTAEIGGAIGGAALPAMVNLQYPGNNAPIWDKGMYYGGNLGLGLLGGIGGTGAALGLRSGINGTRNAYYRYDGKRNLTNQLTQGGDFTDIYFGKMNKQTLKDVNQLRQATDWPLLSDDTYIPANVIRKLHDKRLNEKYTPQQISDIAGRLFHKGGNLVTEGRHPHIQQIIHPTHTKPEVGYVAQNPSNGQTVVKSVYKKIIK